MRYNQKYYRVVFDEGEKIMFFCIGYNLDVAEEFAAVEIFSNPIRNIQLITTIHLVRRKNSNF